MTDERPYYPRSKTRIFIIKSFSSLDRKHGSRNRGAAGKSFYPSNIRFINENGILLFCTRRRRGESAAAALELDRVPCAGGLAHTVRRPNLTVTAVPYRVSGFVSIAAGRTTRWPTAPVTAGDRSLFQMWNTGGGRTTRARDGSEGASRWPVYSSVRRRATFYTKDDNNNNNICVER